MTHALILEEHLEAVVEEGQQVVADIRLVASDLLDPFRRIALDLVDDRANRTAEHAMGGDLVQDRFQQSSLVIVICRIDFAEQYLRIEQAVELQPHTVFQQQPDDAECGTAQRIRVLGSGGLFIDCPETGQRVELVGQRHRHGYRIGGHVIGGSKRLVMLLDCQRHGSILASLFGIAAAHLALNLGEFEHHRGLQISLGEKSRAFGFFRIRTNHWCQALRQRHDTLDALTLGAEFCVEGNVVEPPHPFIEAVFLGRLLQIAFPEETGIRQPCRDHLAVATGHFLAAI